MKKLSIFLIVGTVTLTQGCKTEEVVPNQVKLISYTETFEIDGFGFEPQSKVEYDYDEYGNLSRYTFYGYNPDLENFEAQRYFILTYKDSKVNKIEGFHANDVPDVNYEYFYQTDGKLLKITEENKGAGVNSEASFEYKLHDYIKVSYRYSNGGSFEYEFQYVNENIVGDKTTRGSALCSEGEYNLDDHPNPFRALGFIDYALFNMSANNRLTENVEYVGCAFPSLIPESYNYQYNANGYPSEMTTNFKPGGIVMKSHKKFLYE